MRNASPIFLSLGLAPRHGGVPIDLARDATVYQNRQFRAYTIQNARVFARFGLPEQTNRRIPGTIVAIEQPTPVRNVRQEDPDRSAETSGEMGYAGVHRDHQVEARDQR